MAAAVLLFAVVGGGAYSLFGGNNSSVEHGSAAPIAPQIPETDFPIPQSAIYVSTDGSDSSSGAINSPLNSLQAAVNKIPTTGGTIVMRGGTYRENHVVIGKPITITSYAGEQVWFDGTEQVSSWTSNGNGTYYITWDTPDFCGGGGGETYYSFTVNSAQFTSNMGPCHHRDMSNDPDNVMAWDPQMVFKNGVYIKQLENVSQVDGNNFHYDRSAKRLTIGFNPAGNKVELAKRPKQITFYGNGANSKIVSVGFKRFATNEHQATNTNSAVYVAATDVTLDKIVVWQNAGTGIHVATPINNVVKNSLFLENGFNGLGASGNIKKGIEDNMVLLNNVFRANNQEKFGTNCTLSCSQAGVKIAHMNKAIVKDNVFIDNKGWGYWCDLYCKDIIVTGNYAIDNSRGGVISEASTGGTIASNVIIGNGYMDGNGTRQGLRICSEYTKVYNNTIINNKQNVWIYDDPRAYQFGEISAPLKEVEFVNNIVYGGDKPSWVKYGRTHADTFFSVYKNNSYYRPNNTPSVFMNWQNAANDTSMYGDLSSFHAGTGLGQDDQEFVTGGDPFFINIDSHDYRVRKDSSAYNSAAVLPTDIAAQIGVSPTGNSRGAIKWVDENMNYVVSPSGGSASSGDVNDDGKVDVIDLSMLLTDWGTTQTRSDFSSDNKVDIVDLSILLSNWT